MSLNCTIAPHGSSAHPSPSSSLQVKHFILAPWPGNPPSELAESSIYKLHSGKKLRCFESWFNTQIRGCFTLARACTIYCHVYRSDWDAGLDW
jgi:hypothetical protein